MVSEYATYAEALNRGDADKGKSIVVMGEENVIDCNGVGFDSKKAKKIIAPSNTKVSKTTVIGIQEKLPEVSRTKSALEDHRKLASSSS